MPQVLLKDVVINLLLIILMNSFSTAILVFFLRSFSIAFALKLRG